MQLLTSRINFTSIVAILIASVSMFMENGAIAAAVGGLIIYVLQTAVVIKDKFAMTNDPWILGLAILGAVISIMQLIVDTTPFHVNVQTWTYIIGILTIISRQFSTLKTAAK